MLDAKVTISNQDVLLTRRTAWRSLSGLKNVTTMIYMKEEEAISSFCTREVCGLRRRYAMKTDQKQLEEINAFIELAFPVTQDPAFPQINNWFLVLMS